MAKRRHFTMQMSDILGKPMLGLSFIEWRDEAAKEADWPWSSYTESHDGEPYKLTECEPCNALAMLEQAFLECIAANRCEHTLLHFLIHADALKSFAETRIPRARD